MTKIAPLALAPKISTNVYLLLDVHLFDFSDRLMSIKDKIDLVFLEGIGNSKIRTITKFIEPSIFFLWKFINNIPLAKNPIKSLNVLSNKPKIENGDTDIQNLIRHFEKSFFGKVLFYISITQILSILFGVSIRIFFNNGLMILYGLVVYLLIQFIMFIYFLNTEIKSHREKILVDKVCDAINRGASTILIIYGMGHKGAIVRLLESEYGIKPHII